mmetsp:Transcript_12989/g.39980  ORF Transcript_12989/g.39980 Transcript_12989/m.39980 type:complete len:207 (-) Transcript_12989:54-674(-)
MHSSDDCASLGPNRSASGPMINRMRIVPATATMLDVTRGFFSPMPISGDSSPMFTSSGDSENQPKNAMKKDDHAKKNARWCGLSNLHGLSTLDLCFSSTGTLNWRSVVSTSTGCVSAIVFLDQAATDVLLSLLCLDSPTTPSPASGSTSTLYVHLPTAESAPTKVQRKKKSSVDECCCCCCLRRRLNVQIPAGETCNSSFDFLRAE